MSNRRTIIIWYNNGICYIVWHFKESLTHKIREHQPFKEKTLDGSLEDRCSQLKNGVCQLMSVDSCPRMSIDEC